MEKLKEILEELHPEIDFEKCKTLIDDEYLDSLDIVNLIVEISDAFDIEIPPQDIIAENFNSMEALQKMIERLAAWIIYFSTTSFTSLS